MKSFSYELALALLITASCCCIRSEAARKPADSILLSSVKTLTLRKDLKTTHRRVSAVPQVSFRASAFSHHLLIAVP